MTEIGNAYAQGLYSLACEEGVAEDILQQLQALDESFVKEPDFLRLLSAENLSKEERCSILDSSFRNKVHPYVLNFLKILTEKGYIRQFHNCSVAYQERFNEDNGIIPVCAVSAVSLTDDQKSRLTEKLVTMTGKKISLTNRVDSQCIGGICLNYDGKRIDGTVKNRLDEIHRLLKNTVL